MILITVIVVGLMLFGFFGIVFFGVMGGLEKNTQKNAEKILDETFDGSDTATYKVSGMGGLRFEQVLEGAEKRGYALHAQNQDNSSLTTLVFKKSD